MSANGMITGRQLRTKRQNLGRTVKEVAQLLSVTTRHLNLVEKGERPWHLWDRKCLRHMAFALGFDVDDVLLIAAQMRLEDLLFEHEVEFSVGASPPPPSSPLQVDPQVAAHSCPHCKVSDIRWTFCFRTTINATAMLDSEGRVWSTDAHEEAGDSDNRGLFCCSCGGEVAFEEGVMVNPH